MINISTTVMQLTVRSLKEEPYYRVLLTAQKSWQKIFFYTKNACSMWNGCNLFNLQMTVGLTVPHNISWNKAAACLLQRRKATQVHIQVHYVCDIQDALTCTSE